MIRVVKVGGSLFDWPPLPSVLQAWLLEQIPAVNVLLAGGGSFTDVIRRADSNFALGEETSHWLAIDALSVSARLLAALLPAARLVTSYLDLIAKIHDASTSTIIFDPHEFLRSHEFQLPGNSLPHSWAVTSDSIAARLAHALPAAELVLLKSSDPPKSSLADLASAGYVDSHLPTMQSDGVSIRFVNVRANALALALQSEGKLR